MEEFRRKEFTFIRTCTLIFRARRFSPFVFIDGSLLKNRHSSLERLFFFTATTKGGNHPTPPANSLSVTLVFAREQILVCNAL